MTLEEALVFLQTHQPMPPTALASPEDIESYESALIALKESGDSNAIPLLLNSFGEGDLNGVYMYTETALTQFSSHDIIPHLKQALGSPHDSVRYWCTQISFRFPSRELLPELIAITNSTHPDLRSAAYGSLGEVSGPEITAFLVECYRNEPVEELRTLLKEILEARR